MKVVHSCTSRSFSGLERYVLDFLTWQREQGKDAELFCRAGTELERHARAEGIPVWTISEQSRPGPLLWASQRSTWRRKLATGGGTVLHMHAGGEPWYHLPWLLARPKGLEKTILQYHIWINHRKMDPLHRILFSGIDEVWSSSESARAHLASLLPVNSQAMRVVPYGRDVRALAALPRPERRAERRAELGIAEDETVGIAVSRIEPIKGIGALFDAFIRIAPRFPKGRLLIVGDASPRDAGADRFFRDLKARRETLDPGTRDRIRFLGHRADCLDLMMAADFYVLPSFEECMSLAMLDALVLGLPVLGTNSGGTPSVARPSETGWLVPPRDVPRLAEALAAAYADPVLRARLGEGARELGSQFDREGIFERIWDWYGAPAGHKMMRHHV